MDQLQSAELVLVLAPVPAQLWPRKIRGVQSEGRGKRNKLSRLQVLLDSTIAVPIPSPP